jgi:hypothetical protein
MALCCLHLSSHICSFARADPVLGRGLQSARAGSQWYDEGAGRHAVLHERVCCLSVTTLCGDTRAAWHCGGVHVCTATLLCARA